jgi:hypothetical protein
MDNWEETKATCWPRKFIGAEEKINYFLHLKQQMDQDETSLGEKVPLRPLKGLRNST